MGKWEKIKSTLNQTLHQLDDQSKEDLIQQISVYHEELYFQNEELKRINLLLEKTKDDFQYLFDAAPIGYITIDSDDNILTYNTLFSQWFDVSEGMKLSQLVDPDSQDDFYFFLKMLKQNVSSRSVLLMSKKSGKAHLEFIGKSRGNETGIQLIACVDVEEEHQAMEKIRVLSFKDQLTGLYNRRYYEEEIHRLDHPRMLPLSVILADVNGLKLVNDAFGHRTGDLLIKKAAEIMKTVERETDFIARIGGDEFAVLLPNTSNRDCQKILNRFKASCDNLRIDDINFSIAFGAATMEIYTQDIEEVIALAEENMYRAKLLDESSKRAEVIQSILATLHIKHSREEFHSKRVSEYMVKMAQHLNFSHEKVELMRVAGLLHDIGKIAIEYSILDKSTKLTKEDLIEIRRHPEIGYRILKSSSTFSEISEIVLHHHERVDGNGYPKGLEGEEIPYAAKLLCVCDAYDAMVSDRPYRKGMAKSKAIQELLNNSGTQFDKDIVDAFIVMIQEFD